MRTLYMNIKVEPRHAFICVSGDVTIRDYAHEIRLPFGATADSPNGKTLDWDTPMSITINLDAENTATWNDQLIAEVKETIRHQLACSSVLPTLFAHPTAPETPDANANCTADTVTEDDTEDDSEDDSEDEPL